MASYPKISIVTPSFNQAQYLERTIKSIVNQGYPDLEYIILDGGSTDGSPEIIERYVRNLSYWRSHPDKGQGNAIWQGIEMATGDVFAWLNSDDVYLPGTLDFIGRYFAEHPACRIVAGNCLRIGEDGRILNKFFCNPSQSVKSMVFWGCWCLQPAVFWRRDLLLDAGPIDPNLVLAFDSEFAIRYTRLAHWHKVERFLAGIRIHPQTKTSRLRELSNKEHAEYIRRYDYYQAHTIERLMLRAFYRSRYEIQRILVNIFSPDWHAKVPTWGNDPENADPV
jgi:glycosyltransferase involved in cell wall biosynthesis